MSAIRPRHQSDPMTGRRPRRLIALATLLALTLAGASGIPAAAAAPAAQPRTTLATLPTLPSAQDASNAADNLAKLNAARRDEGRTRLTLHPALAANAYMWSTTMALVDRFAHNPDRSAELSPLNAWGNGENIAWASWGGTSMGTTFHDMWMNSAGHRANILRDGYTHVGVGIYTAPSGGTYGTQVFATLPDATLPTPTITGFGGTVSATTGSTVRVSVTAGSAGVVERLTSGGWAATGVNVPAGTSVVRIPAPAATAAADILRITLPATSRSTVTWSPALAITSTATTTPDPVGPPTTPPASPRPVTPPQTTDRSEPSRLVSSTWPKTNRSVKLGKSVTAKVKVRAGAWVLERRAPGSKRWVTAQRGTAATTTTLTFKLKPTRAGTSTFRLRLPATASAKSRTLTSNVTARRTSTVTVSATRLNAKTHRTVTVRAKVSSAARVQRLTNGTWRTVARVSSGSTKVKLRAGKAGTTTRYRVVVPRTTKVTGATSKTVRVIARR